MTASKPAAKTKSPPAQHVAKLSPEAERTPLYIVTPAVGNPWSGEIVEPQDSDLGGALLCAREDAELNETDINKYVIVRCMRNGGNLGLEEGMDYLVLSRFVHKM